jgi:serine/threonine protein kinase
VTDEERICEWLVDWEESKGTSSPLTAEHLTANFPHLTEELTRRIRLLEQSVWMDRMSSNSLSNESLTHSSECNVPRLLAKRYELQELIGVGGFSQVWRGFDHQLQRLVAIKLPKKDLLVSRELFFDEARRVARLRHSGIVSVFDVGIDDEFVFIVTELVDQGDLHSFVKESKVDVKQACKWICEIADALHHAHANNIIHRDIKPSNILVRGDGKLLVSDFGIAQSHQVPGQLALGTLAYMSPEQIRGENEDVRSDVYSMGVLLHELASGCLPYKSNCPEDLQSDIQCGRIELSSKLPLRLKKVCQKAMHSDPRQRYQDVRQLADDIRTLLNPNRRFANGMIFLGTLASFGSIGFLSLRGRSTKEKKQLPVSDIKELTQYRDDMTHVLSVAISGDGKRLVSGDINYGLKLWEVGSGRKIREFKGHVNWIRSVKISHTGDWVLSGSGGYSKDGKPTVGDDNTVRLWDCKDGSERNLIVSRKMPILGVAFSPDEAEFLGAGAESIVFLWDSEGNEIRRMEGHHMHIQRVAFIPGSRFAVSVGDDAAVHLWNLDSGKEIARMLGHTECIEALASSSNGRWIATGSKDRSIRIWSVKSGGEIRRLIGHTNHIRGVRFLQGDRYVLSGCTDGTLKLWDLETSQLLITINAHATGINDLDVSNDGRVAVTAGKDGLVKIWALPILSKDPLANLTPDTLSSTLPEIETTLEQSRIAFERTYYDIAALRSSQVLARDPFNAEACCIIGRCFVTFRQPQRAQEYLKRAIDLATMQSKNQLDTSNSQRVQAACYEALRDLEDVQRD